MDYCNVNLIGSNKKGYSSNNYEIINRNYISHSKQKESNSIDKIKTKSKIYSKEHATNYKNYCPKAISVNKHIQYKKKASALNNYNYDSCITSMNFSTNLKDSSYNNKSYIGNNTITNNNMKNFAVSQGQKQNNFTNNTKLRRKMILTVDQNVNQDLSKNDIINTENKLIHNITNNKNDNEINSNENNKTNSNVSSSITNPMSNGAKISDKQRQKSLSINYHNHSKSNININNYNQKPLYNNVLINMNNNDKKTRQSNNNIKNENSQLQPFKLYNENSIINLHNSNNNAYQTTYTDNNYKSNLSKSQITNNNNNINNALNIKFIKEVNDLYSTMNKNLNNNPTNSKSKKYNTLKHGFEDLLKLLNDSKKLNNNVYLFLEKILIGYHEVVSAFSLENRKLKQTNYRLTEQYEKTDKKLIEANKSIKEKQLMIDSLEAQLGDLLYNNNVKNMQRDINDNFLISGLKELENNKGVELNTENNSESNEKQNVKILKINEQNLDDLDALYFFDKIKMKSQRSSSGQRIPTLPIGVPNPDEYHVHKLQKAKTKKDLLGKINKKYYYNSFLKVKEAFE